MGYYDMDDYIEEPRYPEVDELLDSVRGKIKENLIKDVTDEVIYSSDIYKECQETIKKLRSDLCQKENNISLLGTVVKDLEARIDKMKQTGTYAEYAVGDVCWYAKAASRYEVTCPLCRGVGRIKVQLAEETVPPELVGETEVLCPKCKNETYYWTDSPHRKIKKSRIH